MSVDLRSSAWAKSAQVRFPWDMRSRITRRLQGISEELEGKGQRAVRTSIVSAQASFASRT